MVQDLGRFGYQRFGLPPAGFMDEYSAKLANILVNNDLNDALLEVTGKGPILKARKPVEIGFAGGDFKLTVNGDNVSSWQSLHLKKGDILNIGAPKKGFRGYLSISGGIKSKKVLNSKSTYMKGSIGGLKGKGNQIKEGNIIKPVKNDKAYTKREIPEKFIPNFEDNEIRITLGPQKNKFTKEGIKTLLNTEYQITSDSDRMGYRLEGPKIEQKEKADIITDAIPRGAIQIPGNGKPIILMNDRQTTGGYAKIGNVITIDLPKISQKKPGSKIKFKQINLSKAQELYKERENKIREIQQKNIVKEENYITKINGNEYLVTYRKHP